MYSTIGNGKVNVHSCILYVFFLYFSYKRIKENFSSGGLHEPGYSYLLTQKQLQEIADLTTFCHRHDGIELSYPVEEEHLTHFLGYLADGRLAACLTLISYEETLAECCAFTHPEFRRQGFFSRLLDEAVS